MLSISHYRLVALLPLLGILAGILIYYIVETQSQWYDPALLILPPVFGVVVSFLINFFFPVSTNIRRAIHADLLVLILSAILLVIAIILTISPYSIIIITYVFGILAILNTFLVVFGWLGAKASGSRYRWWIFSAVVLAFLVIVFIAIVNIPCTTCPAESVL